MRFVNEKTSRVLDFVEPGQLDKQTLRGLRELEPSSALQLDVLLPPMHRVNLAESLKRELSSVDRLEIKDWYDHEYSPSIFIMFRKDYEIVWSFSGNELRRGYLENPDGFISSPIEVAIPEYLDKALTDYIDNF